MDAAQLDRLVRDAIASEPEPPRSVPRWVLLEHSVLNGPALVVVAVGAATLWAVSRLGVGDADESLGTFAFVLGALGIGLLGLPLLTYLRLTRVLRHGVRTVARVTALDRPDTVEDLDARRRQGPGAVRGHRLVEHPAGLFEEAFAVDAEWAGELTEGSEIDVLVHPRRPAVLLELGVRPDW